MRLTVEDIYRLNAEVEQAEIRALQRYLDRAGFDEIVRLGYELEMEYEHSDWGDRD